MTPRLLTIKSLKITSLLFLALLCSPTVYAKKPISHATVYENAEDGLTERWLSTGANRGLSTISNVFDTEADSRVIELFTATARNSFMLGQTTASGGWDNQSQFLASWYMKTNSEFRLWFYVDTAQGQRVIRYDNLALRHYSDLRQTGRVVRLGLGSASNDGSWQHQTRDLHADLAAFQPDNTLLAVNGMRFKGSASLDNIELQLQPDDPAPVADFVAASGSGQNSMTVSFDASTSTDNKPIARYDWDFGNGETGQGVQTAITYATEGEKTVTLTVTDTANQTHTQIQTIEVTDNTSTTLPTASFTTEPLSTSESLTINFDASSSEAYDAALLENFAWEFGDNSSGSGINAQHTYAESGDYLVSLTVTDSNGLASTTSESITVSAPEVDPEPIASFTAVAGSGNESLTVELDASASQDNSEIILYQWDFGNGGTAEGVQTNVSYAVAGEKTISLTVTDSANQTNTLVQTILLTDDSTAPPTASFTVSQLSNDDSLSLNFDASDSFADESAEIVSYDWEFGDGNSDSGISVDHSYLEPGEFTVLLQVTDSNGLESTISEAVTVDVNPPDPDSAAEAARLLTQASFGPTTASIAAVQSLGIENWIDDQLQQMGPAHLDYVYQYANNGSDRYTRHDVWWLDAVNGTDQLRQRVAFALSQIFVISDAGYNLGNSQYGVTRYYDILRENAFGSFRELLEDISLSPIMGLYLSMLQNAKADLSSKTISDENYAREVMQLFTIGPHALRANGTTKTQDGLPIPSFSQTDVEELARVFTGWNYKDATRWNEPLGNSPNIIDPMEPYPGYHDDGSKTLFDNIVIPAGQSARQDLEQVLDVLANHRNTGPFIVKQLIQKLVTSNPTPAYVARISAVFANNGSGVRGDLGAVVRAMLLDTEARQGHQSLPTFGKLREPLLRLSHLWRAFNIQPGAWSNVGEYNTNSPHVQGLVGVTGQAPLRANSVFNFFSRNYAPLGPVQNAGMVAPEAELYVDSLITTTTTRINTQIQRFYASTPYTSDLNQSTLNFSTENTLAADPGALLDHLDILLLSGSMSDEMRRLLIEHMEGFPDTATGLSKRVRDTVSLIMASPEYLVQR